MIDDAPRNSLELIVLWTLITICSTQNLTSAGPEDICDSEVCQLYANVFEKTVNSSLDPCDDFFTYVCAGWTKNLIKTKGKVSKGMRTWGTQDSLEGAVGVILLRRLKQIRARILNSSYEGILDFEMQPIKLFESCMRAAEKTNWDTNLLTLQKFFHDIGLPFFGEKVPQGSTPLTVMMKLALQFDINPLFQIDFAEGVFVLSSLSEHVPGPNPPPIDETAQLWKRVLLSNSNATSKDLIIRTEYASVFDAFGIRLSPKVLLRMGRNFMAVEDARRDYIREFDATEALAFGEWSHSLNSTYFDFFNENIGNLAIIQKNHTLALPYHWFEALVIVSQDRDVRRILNDYLVFYILRTEFKELIGRTKCSYAKCNLKLLPDKDRNKFCGQLTQKILPWSVVEMVSRVTHSDYSLRVARYLFSLEKALMAQRIADLYIFGRMKYFILDRLASVRARGLYQTALQFYENTELRFSVSRYDFAYNLIQIKSANRAKSLARVGYPFHRGMDVKPDHPAFTWVRETRDVYLPAGLLEFPVMVEALPVWTAIGPLGWIIGRLIGRAFAVALKEFADTEVHPDNRYDSFYYDTYMRNWDCFAELFKTPDNITKSREYSHIGVVDNIGLVLSYDAFRWYKAKKWIQKLPMKDCSLTLAQQYFFHWTYGQCFADNEFPFRWTGRSSPPRFHRVNRGLAVFKPFHVSFKCGGKDDMVPPIVCNLLPPK